MGVVVVLSFSYSSSGGIFGDLLIVMQYYVLVALPVRMLYDVSI